MLPADVVLEVESDQVILATGNVGLIFIGAAVVRANDSRRNAQPAHLSRESGIPRPHLHQKTGLAPPTSAPGLSASHLGTAVRRNASSYV